MSARTLTPELLQRMNAYWRAANYLSVGQIYLYDNPLLRVPLTLAHVKPLVVGHWGTTPGQNFIYVNLNRVIKKYDLDMFYVAGPGHGGPAIVGNVYLEGTWTEVYQDITLDEAGLKKLFKQFSFPGGISCHVAPTTPGSINEGGELGYSLSHAFGAAFDNPELIVACVIGSLQRQRRVMASRNCISCTTGTCREVRMHRSASGCCRSTNTGAASSLTARGRRNKFPRSWVYIHRPCARSSASICSCRSSVHAPSPSRARTRVAWPP